MYVIPEAPPASLDYPPASLTPESSSDCWWRTMYPLMGPNALMYVMSIYKKKASFLELVSWLI